MCQVYRSFLCFYDSPIEFLNCSDSVDFFCFSSFFLFWFWVLQLSIANMHKGESEQITNLLLSIIEEEWSIASTSELMIKLSDSNRIEATGWWETTVDATLWPSLESSIYIVCFPDVNNLSSAKCLFKGQRLNCIWLFIINNFISNRVVRTIWDIRLQFDCILQTKFDTPVLQWGFACKYPSAN